jgi:hypothetical protein
MLPVNIMLFQKLFVVQLTQKDPVMLAVSMKIREHRNREHRNREHRNREQGEI